MKRRCSINCNKAETCEVKTCVKRCTCDGLNVEMCDKSVFDMETKKKITAPGFPMLSEVNI